MTEEDQKLYLLKILTWFSSFVIVLFHYGLWFELNFYEKNIFIDYLLKKKNMVQTLYIYTGQLQDFFLYHFIKNMKI